MGFSLLKTQNSVTRSNTCWISHPLDFTSLASHQFKPRKNKKNLATKNSFTIAVRKQVQTEELLIYLIKNVLETSNLLFFLFWPIPSPKVSTTVLKLVPYCIKGHFLVCTAKKDIIEIKNWRCMLSYQEIMRTGFEKMVIPDNDSILSSGQAKAY